MSKSTKKAKEKPAKPAGKRFTTKQAVIILIAAIVLIFIFYLGTPRQVPQSVPKPVPQPVSQPVLQPIKGGDWNSFIFNYNNSRYQVNSTITASNIAQLKPDWNFSANSIVTSTPIVSAGNLYFTDWNGFVYSMQLSNGTLNWKTNLGYPISSTVAVNGGKVYVGYSFNAPAEIAALSENNGSVIWNTMLNNTVYGVWGSPTLYDGLVYIGVASKPDGPGWSPEYDQNASYVKGKIFALNATTGKIVWTFTTMIGNTGGAGVWSSAVVDPELNSIFFGTGNAYENNTDTAYSYSIISLNATTGSLNWAHPIYNSTAAGDDLDFGETPNIFMLTINGTTYQAIGDGSKNGNYYVLNRLNGKLLETFPIGTGGSAGGIAGLAGYIYISKDNPEIFVPSFYSGDNGTTGIVKALLPSNDSVAWKFYTSGDLRGSTTVVPGAVIFGDDEGYIYAVSTTNGALLMKNKLNPTDAGVTVAEGHMIVADEGNPSIQVFST